jgi:hypothetical protein
MSERFKGMYEVADGYVGGSRPQFFSVHAGDLEDDMTDEDLERLYEEEAQAHFEQHIAPNVSRVAEFVAWARAQIANRD